MPNPIDNDYLSEKTEVLYGSKNIINKTLEYFSTFSQTYNNVTDSSYPYVLNNVDVVRNAYRKMKDRGAT